MLSAPFTHGVRECARLVKLPQGANGWKAHIRVHDLVIEVFVVVQPREIRCQPREIRCREWVGVRWAIDVAHFLTWRKN